MTRLLLVSVLAVAACGAATEQLKSAPEVPGAQGEVKAASGSNGNTEIDVRVKHLAPPGKVAANATTYVVWAKPRVGQGAAQNLGALEVSKDESGELRTVTPMKHFDVIVTPEPSPQSTEPSHDPVLTASVDR